MRTFQILFFVYGFVPFLNSAGAATLDSFNWTKMACPTEDMIAGQDFNRILAEEFIRAELEGSRMGGSTCFKPGTYRYFAVSATEMGDDGAGEKINVPSKEDVQIVSITRFPSPNSDNLKLVRYAVQPAAKATSSKGRGKSKRVKKPAPIFGDFVFERIKNPGAYKDSYGCAALYRPPTHLLIHSCK